MEDRSGNQRQHQDTARKPVRLGAKVGIIMATGIVVGLSLLAFANHIYRNALYTRVRSLAIAFDSQKVASLRVDDMTGGGSDDAAQNYTYLKAKLAAVKRANEDLHFVYLMGRSANGSVYFLADSEKPGSEGFSARGEAYPEATPALKAVFTNSKPLIEGPSRDSYGNWLSALAPINNWQPGQRGEVVAVIGIDVPASFYLLFLALTGGTPILIAGLISGLVWSGEVLKRRRQAGAHFQAEMVSIASHELRTPLTGLRWSQEGLLKEKRLTKTQRQSVEAMYGSTLQLQESIEDILQLANLGAEHTQQLHLSATDVRQLLESVVLTQTLAAERQGVQLVFQKGWPDKLELVIDAVRAKRVFNNLVSNAIKYSLDGGKVELGYSQRKGKHIISVIDHGLGIPVAEQAKVFAGFYRASNVTAHGINGTGMGLYVSKAIIEQHGGAMWFTSAQNKGTSMFVELP